MQDNVMQAQTQPFVKLAQANMELLTRFSTSPEVTAQATASATSLFQQSAEAATNLMRSNAFAHLMQGMLKNYTEFLMEVGQSSMAMMSQGQEALLQQVQQASAGVTDVTDVRTRRSRQTA
jgi:intracellular sulfur oxidation DsrE/DsrF family protein